uniref:Spidroin-1-like n=1 Tax=Castor canadensis TaxID=51338 RepID=A0A8B7TUQ9_CASCN|nr:spidroin-1-like [Castor canadensis]
MGCSSQGLGPRRCGRPARDGGGGGGGGGGGEAGASRRRLASAQGFVSSPPVFGIRKPVNLQAPCQPPEGVPPGAFAALSGQASRGRAGARTRRTREPTSLAAAGPGRGGGGGGGGGEAGASRRRLASAQGFVSSPPVFGIRKPVNLQAPCQPPEGVPPGAFAALSGQASRGRAGARTRRTREPTSLAGPCTRLGVAHLPSGRPGRGGGGGGGGGGEAGASRRRLASAQGFVSSPPVFGIRKPVNLQAPCQPPEGVPPGAFAALSGQASRGRAGARTRRTREPTSLADPCWREGACTRLGVAHLPSGRPGRGGGGGGGGGGEAGASRRRLASAQGFVSSPPVFGIRKPVNLQAPCQPPEGVPPGAFAALSGQASRGRAGARTRRTREPTSLADPCWREGACTRLGVAHLPSGRPGRGGGGGGGGGGEAGASRRRLASAQGFVSSPPVFGIRKPVNLQAPCQPPEGVPPGAFAALSGQASRGRAGARTRRTREPTSLAAAGPGRGGGGGGGGGGEAGASRRRLASAQGFVSSPPVFGIRKPVNLQAPCQPPEGVPPGAFAALSGQASRGRAGARTRRTREPTSLAAAGPDGAVAAAAAGGGEAGASRRRLASAQGFVSSPPVFGIRKPVNLQAPCQPPEGVPPGAFAALSGQASRGRAGARTRRTREPTSLAGE